LIIFAPPPDKYNTFALPRLYAGTIKLPENFIAVFREFYLGKLP
jgi:hypothetical protein